MDVYNRFVVDAFNPHYPRDAGKILRAASGRGHLAIAALGVDSSQRAANAITRPGRDQIIRLRSATLKQLQAFFGEFTVDLMISSENVHRGQARGTGEQRRLPFYSRYQCESSAGVNVFRHHVAVNSGGQEAAVGYSFSPPVMVEHIVQHMAECKAHAVVIISDVRDHWFQRVQRATARSLGLPNIDSFGFLHHQGGVRDHVYVRYGMRAAEVDFRNR